MLTAESDYINLTQFRADWTDQTPAANVASYTLEVRNKPDFELLETADFSAVPDALTEDGQGLADISGNYGDYLPDGWTATSYLGAYSNALITAFGGTLNSPYYNLAGYDKVTVVVWTSSYYYDTSSMTVSTSAASQLLTVENSFMPYTIVLDCNDIDRVTFTSVDNYTSIRKVEIYAGEESNTFKATETGDALYRLVTGITDRFYTVTDLEAGGSFFYKVKTVFTDGTESPWSNLERVTLFQNSHGFEKGDVNHDRSINITDVTALIDYLLNSSNPCCEICADVNGDEAVNISDVTALIDMLLETE